VGGAVSAELAGGRALLNLAVLGYHRRDLDRRLDPARVGLSASSPISASASRWATTPVPFASTLLNTLQLLPFVVLGTRF
jgi:hypothetical protein